MQKILRTLIIIAMLITCYLLILAWQKDYANAPKTAPTVATSTTSDIPPVSGDLPISQAQSSTTNNELISVVTDLYDIKINPVGGDVVYSALRQYNATLGTQEPFVILEEGTGRTYVAQSLIGGRDGIDNQARATYHSPQKHYQMTADSLVVPLSYQKDGLTVQKTYTFYKNQYPIAVSHTIANTSGQDWQGELFVQLKRNNFKDPGLADKGALGLATYLGGAWGTPDAPYNKLDFKNFNDGKLNTVSDNAWVALLQHYFVSAWTPNPHQAIATNANTTSTGDMATANNHATLRKFFSRQSGNDNYIGYSNIIDVANGKQITLHDTLYIGPKVQDKLENVAIGLDKTVDYGVFWPISKPLFILLENIHKVLGNWGWSIIALTLIVKIALMWFSNKSYYSMAKMRQIAPRLQALKDKHGDDRLKMSQEMMAIYKEEKVNPMAGCLPILLQMPIFLGLYWCLVESVELRHAPWILWIQDLSAMDPWFILPIFMGVTMYVQQLLNPQPTDPMQAKVMRILPIIFAVFMLFFPAGLVLYWTVNNLFSMTQQHIINKKVEEQYKKRTVKVVG